MTVSALITIINRAIRRTRPIARIDLDVFGPNRTRRAVYLMIGCSLFLGAPANDDGPGRAA